MTEQKRQAEIEAPLFTDDGPKRAVLADVESIEAKVGTNVLVLDGDQATIRVIDRDVCLRCVRQQCINVCPAGCFRPDPERRIEFSQESCIECGACRIVCNEFENIEWRYPRPGFGVQYTRR